MAKWVTLICTAKQISASETRKMSFVFKDASTAEQQKRNWKTAERETERERVKLKEMLWIRNHTQPKGKPQQQHSTAQPSAGDKHTHTHTHSHTHSGQCKLPADMKNYFTAAFTAASICLLPQSICVCSYTLSLLQFRRHSATFACFWSPFSCLLILIYDAWLFCFPFQHLSCSYAGDWARMKTAMKIDW